MAEPPRRRGTPVLTSPTRVGTTALAAAGVDGSGRLAGHWLVDAARTLAEQLLADLGRRWDHTRGVARRATELAAVVREADRPALVAAAWLHDIGYADVTRVSGFHPLDGARHLQRTSWGGPLAGFVAHHSGARFVAAERGLDGDMRGFADPGFWTGRLADALTCADQTTNPDGEPVDVESRLADMLRRHGPDSPQARVHHVRAPEVRAAVARTEQRLLAVHLAAGLT